MKQYVVSEGLLVSHHIIMKQPVLEDCSWLHCNSYEYHVQFSEKNSTLKEDIFLNCHLVVFGHCEWTRNVF